VKLERKSETDRKTFNRRDILFIALSFSVIALFLILPPPPGLSHEGWLMTGILVMAIILWITTPIPIAVTGLLIMIMQPILGVEAAEDVFHSFGNRAVFFLIGVFIIAGAIEKHGLHRRMALKFLGVFEKSPRMFTLGIMISSASLSFIMPAHGVAALLLPIVASILIAMKVIPGQSNFGKVSMLAIAYGCSIGSLGTPIGGARNALTIGILANEGIRISFFEWMKYSMPVVVIAIPAVWLILQIAFPIEIRDISTARKEIEEQVEGMGKMGRGEITVSAILVLTIVMWIFFSSPEYFGLAVIALLGGALLFFTGSISWEDVEKRVPWGIILLYGGAITLGVGMNDTGAGSWIANAMLNAAGSNVYMVILVLIAFTILLTNVMSNVGAVATVLPIGLGVASGISGISPLLASMTVALSGGLAFMLVISTPGNAITYTSGYFSTRDLLKAGTVANIACIGVVLLVAAVYWKNILGM